MVAAPVVVLVVMVIVVVVVVAEKDLCSAATALVPVQASSASS